MKDNFGKLQKCWENHNYRFEKWIKEILKKIIKIIDLKMD